MRDPHQPDAACLEGRQFAAQGRQRFCIGMADGDGMPMFPGQGLGPSQLMAYPVGIVRGRTVQENISRQSRQPLFAHDAQGDGVARGATVYEV